MEVHWEEKLFITLFISVYLHVFCHSLFSHSVVSDSAMPGIPFLHHLLEVVQTHVHWVSDTIQPSCSLPAIILLPSVFPSIRVFSNELALHIKCPKHWSFSFSISPYNEYSRLISFRIDKFDLLAVQGTLKSIIQHHSSKASFLWYSSFYGPVLTSIYDYWKKQNLDYTDLSWQSNVSAF